MRGCRGKFSPLLHHELEFLSLRGRQLLRLGLSGSDDRRPRLERLQHVLLLGQAEQQLVRATQDPLLHETSCLLDEDVSDMSSLITSSDFQAV